MPSTTFGVVVSLPMIHVAEAVLKQLSTLHIPSSRVHLYRAGSVTALVTAALLSRCVFISRHRSELAARYRSARWKRFLETKTDSHHLEEHPEEAAYQHPKEAAQQHPEESVQVLSESADGAEAYMAAMQDAIECWSNGSAQDALALTDIALFLTNAKSLSTDATLLHALLLSCKGQACLKMLGSHEAHLSAACKFLTESVQEASQLACAAAPSTRCSDLRKQAAVCCSSGLAQISLLCSSENYIAKEVLADASVAAQTLAGSTCIELRAQSALALVFAEAGRYRSDVLASLTRDYLRICIEGIVCALDAAEVTSHTAVESILGAASSMAGVLMSKGHCNEASCVWLHALAFLPFLNKHAGNYSVGTVLQQAHNVFERSAAASILRPECAIELEFEPALLTDALQTYCPTDTENSTLPLNSPQELQLSSKWDAIISGTHLPAGQYHDDIRTAMKDTQLPLPRSRSKLRKSARAHSRVPLPLTLQLPVQPDDAQLRSLEEAQIGVVQDRALVPGTGRLGAEEQLTDNPLRNPVLAVSPQWSRQERWERKEFGSWMAAGKANDCSSPDLVPREFKHNYNQQSPSEGCPSPLTLCPPTHMSKCDATPQLWDLTRIPAALVSDPEPQLRFLDSMESPVFHMARVSTASMEGGHIIDERRKTFAQSTTKHDLTCNKGEHQEGYSAAPSPSPCAISSWQLLLAACALRSSRGTCSSTAGQDLNKCSWVLHQSQATPSFQLLQAQYMQNQPHALEEAVMSAVSAANRISNHVSGEACIQITDANSCALDELPQAVDTFYVRPERECTCPSPLHTCSALRAPHSLQSIQIPVTELDVPTPTLTKITPSGSTKRTDGAVRMSFGHSCSIALFAHARRTAASNTAGGPSFDVDTLLHLLQELHNLSFASSSERAAWARARLQCMTGGTDHTRVSAPISSVSPQSLTSNCMPLQCSFCGHDCPHHADEPSPQGQEIVILDCFHTAHLACISGMPVVTCPDCGKKTASLYGSWSGSIGQPTS